MRLTVGRQRVLLLGALVLAGCRERAAALLRFDASMAAPPTPPTEELHQIHFTFTAADAVTFDWRGNDQTLRYWSRDVPPRTVTAHPPSTLPSSPGPWQEAVADGLIPGRDYLYEVGHPLRPVTQSFRAPMTRGATGFTFAAVGEIGATSDAPAAAALHRMLRIADPLFVLGLGGLAHGGDGSADAVDRHFEEVMAWSRRSAYMPVWGKPEWGSGDRNDLGNYKGRFALPHAGAISGAPAAGCCGEDWYWFDQGRVRIITYPEPYARSSWREWADAAAPTFAAAEADEAIRFVVTAGHRAAYSSAPGGGDPELRAILDDLGKRFPKYVLSLSGQARAYERSKPQAHVVHITAGTGGAPLAQASTDCGWPDCKLPPFTAARALHHGFVKITVRGSSLGTEFVCTGQSPGEGEGRCAAGEILDQTAIDAP